MAQVRYIVHDVDAAVAFYTSRLGFTLQQQFGSAMAIVRRDDLTLWLAGPTASASRPMADGARPVPGGWSRIVLTVESLADLALKLRNDGVAFRSDVVKGPGGTQVLCLDPSGNPIELFEPA